MSQRYILTLTCADRPGIVHAVCAGILEVGGNIQESAQYCEAESGTFCLRNVVETSSGCTDDLDGAVRRQLADPEAKLVVRPHDQHPNVLIMVSRIDHCLMDLLYRWRGSLLPVHITAVVSNHETCRELVESYGVPFHYLPIVDGDKAAQEVRLRELIDSLDIGLVVLARYMQILGDELCRDLQGRAINIHHSFLPGFKGARPYKQAHHRGVKLIGATAHFVTADLDEGPIIEQEVTRVNHAVNAQELQELGKDTERLALSRAVRWWAQRRVLLIGDKTVVFS